jgi:hypothetical protein
LGFEALVGICRAAALGFVFCGRPVQRFLIRRRIGDGMRAHIPFYNTVKGVLNSSVKDERSQSTLKSSQKQRRNVAVYI